VAFVEVEIAALPCTTMFGDCGVTGVGCVAAIFFCERYDLGLRPRHAFRIHRDVVVVEQCREIGFIAAQKGLCPMRFDGANTFGRRRRLRRIGSKGLR
jgi:hypothetical protein